MSNPATRLHRILLSAKQSKEDGAQMLVAWGNILRVDGTNVMRTMGKIGKVFALASFVETCVERVPDIKKELFLSWRGDLAKAFNTFGFGNQFGAFKGQLSDSLLSILEFVSHELDKHMPEKELTVEEINELKDAAWNLHQEVARSSLTASLREYLLDNLYRIIEALEDYDIIGCRGVEVAFDAVLGSAMSKSETVKEVGASPFGDKLWALMAKIALALNLAKGAAELTDRVTKALGPPQ